MQQIKVIKRDGTPEDFEVEKIKRVARVAGTSDDEAQKVLEGLIAWSQNKTGSVTSLEIRDVVLEELKKVNTNAANLFAWYQKTKE